MDCEWKLFTDEYGTDLTVIHKKFSVNAFPFSSVEKAYTEQRAGALHEIKLVLKKNIQEAEEEGEIDER